MRKFEDPILETKYVNVFGETIHMVMDEDNEVYIHHNDCTEDFIKVKDFGFIIHEAEKMVIVNFIELATKLVRELDKSK